MSLGSPCDCHVMAGSVKDAPEDAPEADAPEADAPAPARFENDPAGSRMMQDREGLLMMKRYWGGS